MRISGRKISDFYSNQADQDNQFGKIRTPLDFKLTVGGAKRFLEETLIENNPLYLPYPVIPERGISRQNGLINYDDQCKCCEATGCEDTQDESDTNNKCTCTEENYDSVYYVGTATGFNTVQEAINQAGADNKQYPLIYCYKDVTEDSITRAHYVYHPTVVGVPASIYDPNNPDETPSFRMPRFYTDHITNFIRFKIIKFDVKCLHPYFRGTNSSNDNNLYYYYCKFENITLSKGKSSDQNDNGYASAGEGVYLKHCCNCSFKNITTGDGGNGNGAHHWDVSNGGSHFCDDGADGGRFFVLEANCCTFENITIGGGGDGSDRVSDEYYAGGFGGDSGKMDGQYNYCTFRNVRFKSPGSGGVSQFWVYNNTEHRWDSTYAYRSGYGGRQGWNASYDNGCNNCYIDGITMEMNIKGMSAWTKGYGGGVLAFDSGNTIKNVHISGYPTVGWAIDYEQAREATSMRVGSNCILENINFPNGTSVAYRNYSYSAHKGYYSKRGNIGGATGGGGFAIGGTACGMGYGVGRGRSGTYTNVRAKNINFGTGGTSYNMWYDCDGDDKDDLVQLKGGDGGWAGDGAEWTTTGYADQFNGGNLTVTGGSGIATSAGSKGTLKCQSEQPSDGTYTYNAGQNETVAPTDALIVGDLKGDGTDKICNWYDIYVYIKVKDDDGNLLYLKKVMNNDFLTVSLSGGNGEVGRDCPSNCHSPYRIRSKQSTITNGTDTLTITYDNGTDSYSTSFNVTFLGKKLEIRAEHDPETKDRVSEADLTNLSPYMNGYYCRVLCYDTAEDKKGNIYEYDGEPTKDATWSVTDGKTVLMPEDYYTEIDRGRYFVVPYDSTSSTVTINASLIGLSDSKDVNYS